MKRSVLFIALLLSVVPLSAAPKNYGTITTLNGKSFYECRVMRVYPDGVSFTHRNGAAKIAFKELPANLRSEFRYNPKVEAAYQKEQAALRKAEQERKKQQEIVMQEQLMQAQMAEASYLAAASRVANRPAPMSLAQPGETLTTVGYQTPSWVGTQITGPAVGGSAYRGSGYSPYGYGGGYYPASGYSSGYGYPYGGYSSGGYSNYGGYPYYGGSSYGSYPYYGGYSYGSYPSYGGYYGGGSGISGSWNIGHGIHIGVGLGSFGHHHH